MLYTEEQVKRVVLAFYEYLPKNPAHHNESIYDAWWEAYGDKVANRKQSLDCATNERSE